MRTVGIIGATLIMEILLAIIFISTGIYNVSVTSPDPRPLRWIFSRTRDNSVEHHAKGIAVPPLSDSLTINGGFSHYEDMCVGCHGAPGIERSEIGKGLYPHGPDLVHSAKEMEPAEIVLGREERNQKHRIAGIWTDSFRPENTGRSWHSWKR